MSWGLGSEAIVIKSVGRIKFGRIILFCLITALLFGLFGLLRFLNSFFDFYFRIAGIALAVSAVCFILGLAKLLFFPKALLMLRLPEERAKSNIKLLNVILGKVPYFRISILAFCISITLFWIHKLVFPIGITVSLFSTEMSIARLMFR
jgi:hypothetical protein